MPSSNNWFVAAGVNSGDGSRLKPFHDPWLAFRSAAPGDIIHIAAGTYFGRYDRSSWVINCPDLTVRGGYNNDFSKRTPWQTPSVFAAFSGYEYVRENNLLSGRDEHSGLVLDGLFFDAAGRNTYGDKPVEALTSFPTMDGAIASFNAKQVVIKNCVFANSAAGGVELSGDGSRFENNLVINIIGIGMLNLRSNSENAQPITVVNNTFCFAHDLGSPCGTGGDNAIGIRADHPAIIQDNVFISCGNAAITLYRDLDRISIDRNLFYLTPRDIVNSRSQSNSADITESNIDELEDVGLKSATGNIVQDPKVSGFKAEWLDAYTRHLLANYVKPPREAANALRIANGLSTLTPADLEKEENKGALAPRLAPTDTLKLCFTAKQGFHVTEAAAEIIATPATVALTYRSVDWQAIEQPDATLANQRVELRVGLGYEQNAFLLTDATPTTHMGIRIYKPFSDDGSFFVLAARNTLVSRQFEEAIKYNNGREIQSTYFLRGVYRTDIDPAARQKVTLVVEAIVPAPLLAEKSPSRPEGRDWFVKAGASGGDGTRDKPFRDPFQALDKAEGGDAIHVAGGDYFGKLHSGKWKVLIRNLALLGGYDAEFSARDPWLNPTRLLLSDDEHAKGTPDGNILSCEGVCGGLILDGFIFDGATYNSYAASGSLDVAHSPLSPMVSLLGGTAISVRNCLFINAACSAINIDCSSGVFENNILLNTSGWSLKLSANGRGPWTIRNNSFLFAGDPSSRASTGGASSEGTLLHLTGSSVAVIDSNIFAFAEGCSVRSTIAQQNVSFDHNVFAANLFMHLTDANYLWADSSNWERRAVADTAFASFRGNTLELPALPVDPGFADAAITRLQALSSHINEDQWKVFAKQIGSSLIPKTTADTTVEATEPEPASAAAAAPAASSITDLLASLSSIKEQIKSVEVHKATVESVAPLYCPVYDWKKALGLAQPLTVDGPGARRTKLTVSFNPVNVRADVQYVPVTAQLIDTDHAALDNKSVELLVTGARASSSDPSLFPSGFTSDDYIAYYIATVGDAARTRIIIIVRRDTNASKLLDRTTPNDKLRICGTARIPGNPGLLSIVVDIAEPVES